MNSLSSVQKTASLVLKTIVTLSAVVGTFLSYLAGQRAFMGGSRVFMYFTIQSNIAIAIICAIGCGLLLKNAGIGKAWYIIKFVGTVSITLTGVVFCFVLAPTLGADAWNIQNTLTHVVVPIAAVADFFVTSTVLKIEKVNVFFVTIPPLLYAIYAGIGYVKGWQFGEGVTYPYFFLNWGSEAGAFGFSKELPFMGCVWWILILLLFLILVGFGYLAIADGIGRRRQKTNNRVR
ncbi:MAG: Pr6Pr family membrane protein [Lachnospiraceae bacterium]|nr:Pr6Pr family membrane protein [Lachnospiraceae bacterium]